MENCRFGQGDIDLSAQCQGMAQVVTRVTQLLEYGRAMAKYTVAEDDVQEAAISQTRRSMLFGGQCRCLDGRLP
jgi:hypothetical protein